jgi:hypothetical protein
MKTFKKVLFCFSVISFFFLATPKETVAKGTPDNGCFSTVIICDDGSQHMCICCSNDDVWAWFQIYCDCCYW